MATTDEVRHRTVEVVLSRFQGRLAEPAPDGQVVPLLVHAYTIRGPGAVEVGVAERVAYGLCPCLEWSGCCGVMVLADRGEHELIVLLFCDVDPATGIPTRRPPAVSDVEHLAGGGDLRVCMTEAGYEVLVHDPLRWPPEPR